LTTLLYDVAKYDNASARRALTRLLSEHDFLRLMERVIVLVAANQEYDPSWNISVLLDYLCFVGPNIVLPRLRLDYLNVLDHLLLMRTSHATRLVGCWEKLGAKLGISEEELRAERRLERKAATGGVIGCGWYKCPMYELGTEKEMFRCIRCKKVVYCRPLCQKKDWEEGTHKVDCAKLATVQSPV